MTADRPISTLIAELEGHESPQVIARVIRAVERREIGPADLESGRWRDVLTAQAEGPNSAPASALVPYSHQVGQPFAMVDLATARLLAGAGLGDLQGRSLAVYLAARVFAWGGPKDHRRPTGGGEPQPGQVLATVAGIARSVGLSEEAVRSTFRRLVGVKLLRRLGRGTWAVMTAGPTEA
jgi:hypothetical protein